GRTCRHRPRGKSLLASELSHDFAVEAKDASLATDGHQPHLARLARLEPDRGACGNVEAHAAGGVTVEIERLVGFVEMVVRADLHRAVAAIGNAQRDRLLALVEDDLALCRNDFAGDHLHAPTASHAPPRAVAAPRRRARTLPDEARPALPRRTPRPMPAAWRRAVAAAKPRAKVSAPAAPSSEPCAWPWKKAKKPTIAAAATTGTRSAIIAMRPRAITDARMTGSTSGRGSAISEAAKPAAMQATNAAGTE